MKAHLCRPGEGVRGILVLREVDPALAMQVSQVQNVSIMTYELNLTLRAVDR